ncbi:hypothetical protein V6U77_01055 [Micromonospora sp. CPCC 205546]|uniref:hypothetical protein n=1 Tax=Micromonospora sp. CPCC 205546 TaxID=3122397 RepID=UPI002FF26142
MALVKVALVVTLLSGCAAADPAERVDSLGSPRPTPSPTAATPPSQPPTTPPSARPAGTAARVVLTRSGGIAGRDDTVTVEPDGRWTVVDRAGSRRTGRLSGADLDRLRRLVADPALAAGAGRPATPTACRDAFSYRLTVGTVETGYVDCPSDGDAPTTAREVVELLVAATG